MEGRAAIASRSSQRSRAPTTARVRRSCTAASRADRKSVRLSPLAPWAFVRDDAREEIIVNDFRKTVENWSDGLPRRDDVGIPRNRARQGRPLFHRRAIGGVPRSILRPGLKGTYAIFAENREGQLLSPHWPKGNRPGNRFKVRLCGRDRFDRRRDRRLRGHRSRQGPCANCVLFQ